MAAKTHVELTELAVRWLKRSFQNGGPGCKVAFPEAASVERAGGEIVDAFGYRWGFDGGSTIVEVKTSRADFFADFRKPHRVNPGTGVGEFRYLMAESGLIHLDELPDGWGLLEVGLNNKIIVRRGHVLHRLSCTMDRESVWGEWSFPHNTRVERDILANLLSRLGDAEKLLKKQRATRRDNDRLVRQHNTLVEENHNLQSQVVDLRNKLYDLT